MESEAAQEQSPDVSSGPTSKKKEAKDGRADTGNGGPKLNGDASGADRGKGDEYGKDEGQAAAES